MKAKRIIAWLLSFLMVFSLIMENSKMQVFAAGGAGETNIEESDYVQDEYGVFEYRAVDDTAYGTITVPEGYVFLVDNEVNVTADAIVLEGGAQLFISGGGKMNCSTITASDGATMCLESNANIPSGVTVYDGENDITGDTEWEWFRFIYAAGEGRWYANTEPPFETHYDFCINGLEAGDTYKVEYSYDGTNYSAVGVGIDETDNKNCWVDIEEGWKGPLYFKVELYLGDGDSKELLEYGFGWNGESYTIGMDYPKAGEGGLNVVKDTYQLTFCYPDVSDGLYPHDIHLQVGVPEDPEETETTVTFRVENYGNADGTHNATGTVYYKFNTDENFTSVTAANMIDGTFSPAIPEGATTVTVKAVADSGSEVNKYNIDFPVSNSGNFINEENVDEIHADLTGDGYVFDLSAGSPEFCIRFTQEGAKHYILWNTLSWGGGNVTLENGTVECKKIIFDGKTYTTDSSEVGGNIYSISEITNNWDTAISYKILEGDTIGYDIFVLPYSPEVVVEFELMPAKGYQIASIPSGAMDDQVSEENDIIGEFEPQASSATYQYTFDGSRNIHYVPTFSEGTNTAKVTGSSVTSADVATGNNNIAGNLGLSVAEITESNASSPIKEAVAGADAVYLNIDLNQIISKGANRGNWTTPLTELENEVTISLDVAGYDSNKTYYIVREHDGTCDRLEATYNTTTGKLEFATDRFSTYAIICTDAQTPGGAGETATFVIRESNGQTGTVQYKLNGSGDFTTANNTPVDLEGVTSITIKAIPTGEAKVNQNYSGISGTERTETFDYDALITESGWTYNIQDNDGNITFTIEFDNNDGTGGGSNPGGGENPGGNVASYSVDFGEGSWIVGDVTVTADKSGKQTLSESDIITLTGFDAETMEVRVAAGDGFSTTLAVNNNQTSISAKTNDGGVPTDIVFSVVEKSTGGGEVNNGNVVRANVTVNISGEELEYEAPWKNEAADFVFGINGSEMRRLSKEEVNYTTEGDKIVGLETKEALGYEYNYDDSENVTFNIKTQWDDVITSLKINDVLYDTPQTKDELINAFDADFRGIRFDIENVPYAEEYHIVVEGRKQTQEEKIMGNFGWTYDPNSNEYADDDKIPYGNLEFVNAKYNGVTYDSIEEVNEAGGTFQWDDGVKGSDDPTGAAMFPTGTELTLRLIPDAGYQLTSLDLNGTPFEPGEEVGLYTFTIGGGNWHLGAQFTEVGAEVQASSVNIKSGNIDINENFEYGTAKLEVSDVASMDSSKMEEFENTATDEGYEIENYLDISLYNAVYKGGIKDVNGNYESWDTSVENIENKATITLELENDMSGKDLAVIHELHNGEEIIGYELINATYNEENNTITFETDSFSHYAIVSKGIGEGENVYYIDLGTGSWAVGDVIVSAPEGTSGVVSMLDTETIPTEMLANFDPETMDITLTAGDGFVIYLEIDENGNTTLASTRDGVELPPYEETLTFAVVAKPGNMEIVDKTEENACNADLPELTDDLISKLLTDAEKTKLENGEEVKVWLEATDISTSVSQTDKNLIDSKKGNATIGMYLDIDLLKQIGSDSPVNITDTDGAVTITLKVPSSLMNSNSSVTRTYQMIRVHNGVATVIPCTYNAANQTISCETDQFSTYALAYVDQQNNSGGENTGGGNPGGDSGNGSGSDSGNGSGSDSSNSNDSDNSANGGNGSSDQDSNDATQSYLPTGALFEVNGARYKVTEADTKTRTFSVSFVKVLSKKVKTFKVPTSVTYNGVSYQVVSIGKKAFMGCKKLKKISIGSNVKTINDKAFYSCSVLESITIPSSVTKIGKEAFAKCKKLSSIKIKSNNLTAGKIGKNAFKGIKSNATFKVPKKKMKAYKAMLKKKGVGKKAKFKKL